MFKLNAAFRLKASDIEEHVEDDELGAQDFLNTNPTTAADTLESRDSRDLVPYMFARKLAAKLRTTSFKTSAKSELYQNPNLQHPRSNDLETLTEGATEKLGAMGDNTSETDPLMQDYENSNPRNASTKSTKASSTVDSPFDNFDNEEIPSEMYLEDQPDTVRAAKHKVKPKRRPRPRIKKSKPSAMLERLLDEQSVMYQNEASLAETARSTVDVDSEPGSVHVRFPISDSPTDGSSYMHVRGEATKASTLLNAGFDQEEESPEVLGEPSEDGEVQILSSEDESEEQEVLGDADAKVLWNVANQPLS